MKHQKDPQRHLGKVSRSNPDSLPHGSKELAKDLFGQYVDLNSENSGFFSQIKQGNEIQHN
ncbi:hypothetical protein [Lyngbya confervoides]|uniref:Transposase n=1 Tax=Lyngbya confervoides BDU141951 TaxID=1574623 RepID=A0ABD4T580_9CYAN|nr:hypothetical protein [Lyngbya confervoides]MCM1983814.1 hypothetical protein [Lyngbya confervoides BDU141951]